ncbi:hypothetical protein FKM82_003337 [Ascaphus truei]
MFCRAADKGEEPGQQSRAQRCWNLGSARGQAQQPRPAAGPQLLWASSCCLCPCRLHTRMRRLVSTFGAGPAWHRRPSPGMVGKGVGGECPCPQEGLWPPGSERGGESMAV